MKALTLCLLVLVLATSWAKPVNRTSMRCSSNRLLRERLAALGIKDRNAIPSDANRWKGGVMPYTVSDDFNRKTLKKVREAMDYLSSKTCLVFVERTTEPDYLELTTGNDCSADIGNWGGRHELSLDGCYDLGSAFHELMHAVGFYHEHQRWDRDDYLLIHYDRIQESQYGEFDKNGKNKERRFTPFDFDSIMLYGPTSFAIKKGDITIEAKDGRKIREIEDKLYPSKSDIRRINLLYECDM